MITSDCVISIIVPVYNVAKFLDKCVYSLINQSYRNLEIILVDDGSTDSSPALCDNWKTKDKRVRVIHKKNGGLSEARNYGIEVAKGIYIVFVDGDDYVALDMCEKLLNAVVSKSADIAVCSFYKVFGEKLKREYLSVNNEMIIERDNILETWARYASAEFVIACGKLYKRSLFFTDEIIRYPVGRLHEDEFTTYRLLYTAEKIVFIDAPLYYYVQHSNSIMANLGERNLRDFADAIWFYMLWSQEYAPDKRKAMECIMMRNTLEVIRRYIIDPKLKSCEDLCIELVKYANCNVHNYLFNKCVPPKEKIKYVFYKIGIYDNFIKLSTWFKKRGNLFNDT